MATMVDSSPIIATMDRTKTILDENFQKVASTMNTPSCPPRVPGDVGLRTTKIQDKDRFLDHNIHWLKSKLGRTNDVSTAFDNAVKRYLSQFE